MAFNGNAALNFTTMAYTTPYGFAKALEQFKEASKQLNEAWQKYQGDGLLTHETEYPFSQSFDELVPKISYWADDSYNLLMIEHNGLNAAKPFTHLTANDGLQSEVPNEEVDLIEGKQYEVLGVLPESEYCRIYGFIGCEESTAPFYLIRDERGATQYHSEDRFIETSK